MIDFAYINNMYASRIAKAIGSKAQFAVERLTRDEYVLRLIRERAPIWSKEEHPLVAKVTILKCGGGVGFSKGLEISEPYRNKGLYAIVHAAKVDLAKELGIRTLLATIRSDNAHELHVATKNDWVEIYELPGGHYNGSSSPYKVKLFACTVKY